MVWFRLFTGEYFWLLATVISLIPLFVGVLCYWAAMSRKAVAHFNPKDLQTSYLGALTLPFALFLAFMVGDIWERETRYARTVLEEVQQLDAMLDVTRICGEPCSYASKQLGDYARALALYEWDEDWVNHHEGVSRMLDGIGASIAKLEADMVVPSHLRQTLLSGQIELRKLRSDRYFILHNDLAPHRWLVVLMLGILSQIGLAALHVGKRLQLIVGLATFSIAFSVTLGYTISLAWPTVDESIIPSEELQRILK